jgi:hypothetical protein
MNKGLAVTALPVAAATVAAPLVAAVATAPPASADVILSQGGHTFQYNPSPTFRAVYDTCDFNPFFPICVPYPVYWYMFDSSDYKAWSVDGVNTSYFIFWNDHFNIAQLTPPQIVQANAYHWIERFNQDGHQVNTYQTSPDDCLEPYGSVFECAQGKNEDLQTHYLAWNFAGIGVPVSDDPSFGVYGDNWDGYWFK